jgi:hypothetical protein
MKVRLVDCRSRPDPMSKLIMLRKRSEPFTPPAPAGLVMKSVNRPMSLSDWSTNGPQVLEPRSAPSTTRFE